MTETIAYRVFVHGRVTGVGFRYSAMREADNHGPLRGYVRNATSRTVECLIQGAPADVQAMLAWLRRGPPSARVIDCEVAPVAVDPDLPLFHISY